MSEINSLSLYSKKIEKKNKLKPRGIEGKKLCRINEIKNRIIMEKINGPKPGMRGDITTDPVDIKRIIKSNLSVVHV